MMNEHFRERIDGMGGPADYQNFSDSLTTEDVSMQETGTHNPADDISEHILIAQEGV